MFVCSIMKADNDQLSSKFSRIGDVSSMISADHEQDWQPYPVDPYSAICDDHTYIHTVRMETGEYSFSLLFS